MLTEFETRLAAVLGSRLGAPLTGRVIRRGANEPGGNDPVIIVGVDDIAPWVPDFDSVRPETVPGSDDARRVLRLTVTVGIDFSTSPADAPAEALAALDQVSYELDDLEMTSGLALVAPGDQGFRIARLGLIESSLIEGSPVRVQVDGWFWPVGVAGQAGIAIEHALVRQIRLPIELRVDGALRAGADASAIDVLFGSAGTFDLEADNATSADFGAVAVRLTDEAGGDGSGQLTGGDAGPDDHRVVDVTDQGASLTYTPPDAPATDVLVVATHASDANGNERVGVELARFSLVVQP